MESGNIEFDSRGWERLPMELHDMILERCTWQCHGQATSQAGINQLAVLTTVCRRWQDFFESKLFQFMTLKTEADIEAFKNLVQGRRRAHVQWIWLRLELPMYDCERCHRVETREEMQVQNENFTNLVWNLFGVLSTWKNKEVRRDGITLELSAHSPSDAHHFNKNLRFHLHDTAWNRDDRPVLPHDDPFHGWKDGKQIKQVPRHAWYRLVGSGLRFDYNLPSVRRHRMRLPKVSVVSSLVIRRQSARIFKAQTALNPMIRSLTRLSSFTHEPWRGPTGVYQKNQGWLNAILAREALKSRRKTLKKVSIFESHDGIFHRSPYQSTAQRRTTCSFSRFLARSSHHLEELYVANNIEALEFFSAFHPVFHPSRRRWMVWKGLKYLSLTTQYLSPEYSDWHHGLVLLLAAKAAERMPKLEIMELWNCWSERGIACIFRFRRGETEASIELVTTWSSGLTLTPAMRAAWTRVATAKRPLPLRVEARYWNSGIIDGDYCVLRQLELVDRMLHPVSLRQIARDDQRRREERLAS